MPWLGFPAAVDLANTVVVTAPEETDLLSTEAELVTWVEAEKGRIPGAEAARCHLSAVRALRAPVRAVLFAAAEGRPLPSDAVVALNAASGGALSYPVLRRDGRVEERSVSNDPFADFRAAVARSAMSLLAGGDRDRLDICRAPSCGMLFLRRGAAQKWCCARCGNRSRVARHAQRQRNGDPAH